MNREEAIERLKQNRAAAKFYAGMAQNTNTIENELKDIEALDMAIQALSADAVKVVLCKDCMYYSNGECKSGTLPFSEYSDLANAWLTPRPNDYCSYGERSESCL